MHPKHSAVSATILFYVAFSVMIFSSACSRKFAFVGSAIVPAASGAVKVNKDKNKNYAIEVNVTNLTQPKNLQPPRNTYVVWMETKENGIKNIGQLQSSTSLFSSTLKASLKTVSPYEPDNFFISAEDDADIQFHGTQIVIRTNK
jgi:ribosomal protein S9